MKTYKTPRIKTIKLDTEELLAASPDLSFKPNDYVDSKDARSKRHTGLFDDDESYAD